jgi:hypothetical protein
MSFISDELVHLQRFIGSQDSVGTVRYSTRVGQNAIWPPLEDRFYYISQLSTFPLCQRYKTDIGGKTSKTNGVRTNDNRFLVKC